MTTSLANVGVKRKISDFFGKAKGNEKSVTLEKDEKRLKKEERIRTFLSVIKDEEWRNALLESEIGKKYLIDLTEFISGERKKYAVYPPEEEVFAALDACSLSKIKVVIIGQDPYHGPGQANGLAFSIKKNAQCKYPPSLRNILQQVNNDIGVSISKNATDLSYWARQGVLLLNTVLTVRNGQANSHHNHGWEQFTDAIIRIIDSRSSPKNGVVFLLWGKPALTKCKSISKSKHRIIISSHPSPLSHLKTDSPFTGSNCFSRCNKFLLHDLGYAHAIDWSLPSDEEEGTNKEEDEKKKETPLVPEIIEEEVK